MVGVQAKIIDLKTIKCVLWTFWKHIVIDTQQFTAEVHPVITTEFSIEMHLVSSFSIKF